MTREEIRENIHLVYEMIEKFYYIINRKILQVNDRNSNQYKLDKFF